LKSPTKGLKEMHLIYRVIRKNTKLRARELDREEPRRNALGVFWVKIGVRKGSQGI